MNDAERRLYQNIDALVGEVYADAPGVNATALGFIMTTYRKRLNSSPRAFVQTCRNHLDHQPSGTVRLRRNLTPAPASGKVSAWELKAKETSVHTIEVARCPA